jgi:hypothetical protein
MTSREHARRLMLILLSSEGRPGAKAPEGDATEHDECDGRDGEDECAESDRRVWPAIAVCT